MGKPATSKEIISKIKDMSTNTNMTLMGRRGLGIELKESYYKQAIGSCFNALMEPQIKDLEEAELPELAGSINCDGD